MGTLLRGLIGATIGLGACSGPPATPGDGPGRDDGGSSAHDGGAGPWLEAGTALTADSGLTPVGLQGLDPDANLVDAEGDTGMPVRKNTDAAWTIAAPGDMPSIVNDHGPTVASPVFQAITFANYDLTADIDAFVAQVGSIPYWHGAVDEYGVGTATAAAPVHLAQTGPQQIDDAAIQAWLAAELVSNDGFIAPTPGAIYMLFYPASTIVTFDSQESCFTVGAYHNSTIVAGVNVVYAVVPECASEDKTVLQTTTGAASHEMIEAVTDPLPLTPTPGYSGLDSRHVYDQVVLGGGEVADMCAQWPASFYVPDGFPYMVQRVWSNAKAAAGLDPCQPELTGETYFNAVPVLVDPVHITGAGQVYSTIGANIAPGASKLIDVQLYSEADIGPWSVRAVSVPAGSNNNLAFSWDRTTGTNGDVLHLTITVNAIDSDYGGDPFLIESQLDGVTNYWVGYVGQ